MCEHCGNNVIGNGYTNHCSLCLWSKHVDVNPGDRAEKCAGMMMPEEIILEKGEHVIIHKCLKCGVKRRKVSDKGDNFDAILEVIEK
jgi:hypothetical protein